MKRYDFIKRKEKFWREFEKLLDLIDSGNKKLLKKHDKDFPSLYRRVCNHLDMAKQRNYGAALIGRLNALVLRGHQALYRNVGDRFSNLSEMILYRFPVVIRRNLRLFIFASLLFYGSFALMFFIIQHNPQMVHSVLSVEMINTLEEMYTPDKMRERDFSTDCYMFGYYIYNNTSIGFRTFAGGFLFTLGSWFFLVFNGIFIGAVFSYLYSNNMGQTLFPFVVGHGAFELTAIVISGLTGIKLGLVILMPGNKSRLQALLDAREELLPLVYGFVSMFFIAAVIEAFWSSSAMIKANIKYTAGAFFWLIVTLFFIFSGRGRDD